MACIPTVSSPLTPVRLTKILQRQIFSTVRLDGSSVTEQRRQAVQPVTPPQCVLTRLDVVSVSQAVCRHLLVIQLKRDAVVVTGNFICSGSVVSWYHFFMAQWLLEVQGFLIIEAARSYSDTPHSTGLLWKSD